VFYPNHRLPLGHGGASYSFCWPRHSSSGGRSIRRRRLPQLHPAVRYTGGVAEDL
jgi:hypothetical protein